MAAPVKTLTSTQVLTPVSPANGTATYGTIIDWSGVHLFSLAAFLVRTNSTAHASPWARIVVEGNPHLTDNSLFTPIATLLMPAGASIAQTAISTGAISAGATSFTVSSATNIAAGALLFVSDASSANYEVVQVIAVSGTTITVDKPFVYSHTLAALVSSQAERLVTTLDVSGYQRGRIGIINNSGQLVQAWAWGSNTVL